MTAVRHPASLRDPAGFLVEHGRQLFRVVLPGNVAETVQLLKSDWFLELINSRKIVPSALVADEQQMFSKIIPSRSIVVAHERIGFPSYPSEWPLEMLHAAGELTLSLCKAALTHGYSLKDATPYNVLFRGPRPIFVDLLSFEKRSPHDASWLPYAQFIRMFLLPALLDVRKGIACHHHFFTRRDGIEPQEVYNLLSFSERLRIPFLGMVTVPTLLARRAAASDRIYTTREVAPDKALFILQRLFDSLQRKLKGLADRRVTSRNWLSYVNSCSYSHGDTQAKATFLQKFLQQYRPARVLDAGCNTGYFSHIAATGGAEVIAIDNDHEVVGALWRRARQEHLNILPLVVNLARPTPALGWRSGETLSFLERAEGYFDAVFMLAVIHHLLVTDGIPLDEIVGQAARLTTAWLIIEFVGTDDPQFKRLLRGRERLYAGYNQTTFETVLERYFVIVDRLQLGGNQRWLYLARKMSA